MKTHQGNPRQFKGQPCLGLVKMFLGILLLLLGSIGNHFKNVIHDSIARGSNYPVAVTKG